MDQFRNRPLALVILDGWGIAPPSEWNAISQAHTPFYDQIVAQFPRTVLEASGEAVGLPKGSPGNAHSGHLNIGTGRVSKTEVHRIADSIRDGTFFENRVLEAAFETAWNTNGRVHLIGLLSDAGVHSSPETLFALLRMAKRFELKEAFVHGILDGRDVPPRTADVYAEAVEIKMADIGIGTIASLCGRHYAMDNAENWERTARGYTMLVHGEGEHAADARTAIRSSFLRGISDEFITPIVINDDRGIATLRDGDTVIFFNHRPDTMRQLVRSVAMPEAGGGITKPKLNVVCMTEYDTSFGLPVAFKSGTESNTLVDTLADVGIHTYRISESERFQHITNFFDGGAARSRQTEKQMPMDSEKEADREYAPEMRNFKVTNVLLRSMDIDGSGVFITNLASPGLVAETGNFRKTVEAIQYLDTCLGGIITKVRQLNGIAVITSSHGNCEDMHLVDGSPNRYATSNAVPLHLIGSDARQTYLSANGSLQDVAPTILGLLGLPVPSEMTGRDLSIR
ncbi:MAG TPA: 2,3-bisphosphoglycerate-independent phosphoglycerate mutase [Pyrinomonadaceae bacterium]|jgi:2,3-bisphosphoglycerate-independent phosphoglycerate mutase|nr:2,3-bisphosphoglycerate-independent phosphoglycerate mutase [Pyrinomonadaceae bacterium]